MDRGSREEVFSRSVAAGVVQIDHQVSGFNARRGAHGDFIVSPGSTGYVAAQKDFWKKELHA